MPLDLLLILGGVGLLYGGAEGLVRGASALALRLGLSPLVVGLTVVAFGTSAPELVVSVQATLAGAGGIAVGNVVGSNVANVALILGLSAALRPLRVEAALVRREIPLLVAVTVGVVALLWGQELGRGGGALLLGGLLVYLAVTLRLARRDRAAVAALVEEPARPAGSAWRDGLLAVAGLALLVLGAQGLVRGATAVAAALGVPDAVVGLTVVAVGTSLPELATSAVAAARGAGDLALGNVVGSNLFNLLGILGAAAVVQPLAAPGLRHADLLVMLGLTVLLLPLVRSGFVLSRWEGTALLAAYAVYAGLLLI